MYTHKTVPNKITRHYANIFSYDAINFAIFY